MDRLKGAERPVMVRLRTLWIAVHVAVVVSALVGYSHGHSQAVIDGVVEVIESAADVLDRANRMDSALVRAQERLGQ